MDENRTTINGVTYMAVPKTETVRGGVIHRSCTQCAIMALRHSGVLNSCEGVPCFPEDRKDGRKVIFV